MSSAPIMGLSIRRISSAPPCTSSTRPCPTKTCSGCQTTGGPNGTLADSTNNVLSHEISETITDPDLNAWWRTSDGRKSETSAICNAKSNLPPRDAYDTQMEYSNAAVNCVGAYATLANTHDYNFNMNGDIVWRNSNGDLAMWFMNGGPACQVRVSAISH